MGDASVGIGGGIGGATGNSTGGPVTSVLALVSPEPLVAARFEDFALSQRDGALVSFRGVVRDHDRGAAVTALDYEAHPDAEEFLRRCCEEVSASTGLTVAAGHRVGSLVVGDTALVACVAASHRAEAFAACERLVDRIKLEVPIWKRQHLSGGVTQWVGL